MRQRCAGHDCDGGRAAGVSRARSSLARWIAAETNRRTLCELAGELDAGCNRAALMRARWKALQSGLGVMVAGDVVRRLKETRRDGSVCGATHKVVGPIRPFAAALAIGCKGFDRAVQEAS